jgi:hypothetical protein
LLDCINEANKSLKQWFYKYGIYKEIGLSTSFKTVAGREYRDVTKAVIVGDKSSFTGTAGDKIKVVIDGVTKDDIVIGTATTIALVATAINTSFSATVATVDSDGFLQIESQTTGSTSAVSIADGGTTVQTVIAKLFSVAAERTDTAISDLDEILTLTERVNDRRLAILPYDNLISIEPNPSSNSESVPTMAARFGDNIYFRYTPSSAKYIYIDYIRDIVELTSTTSGSMPFSNRYDNLLIYEARINYCMWKEPDNRNILVSVREKRDELFQTLISDAVVNFGQNNQSESRNEYLPDIRPGIPTR